MAKTRESGSATIYSPKWRKFRLMILRRDGFECAYCSADATAVDHRVSRVQGGDIYDPDNCQAICKSCNSAKGSRSEGLFLAQRVTPLVFASVNFRKETTSTKPDSPFSATLEIETK